MQYLFTLPMAVTPFHPFRSIRLGRFFKSSYFPPHATIRTGHNLAIKYFIHFSLIGIFYSCTISNIMKFSNAFLTIKVRFGRNVFPKSIWFLFICLFCCWFATTSKNQPDFRHSPISLPSFYSLTPLSDISRVELLQNNGMKVQDLHNFMRHIFLKLEVFSLPV